MNEVFAGLPVSFVNLGFTKDDEIQLRMLFGNISRQLNDLLIKRGVNPASVKIYVTTGAPAELQVKNANPSTSSQTFTPSSGYDGFSKVVLSAVTAAIDANIKAENIKKDVTILGVTGTYEGPEPEPEES